MSLSLGGASSPISYKANVLRAPPGLCHQLRAAKGSFNLSQMLSPSSEETSFS